MTKYQRPCTTSDFVRIFNSYTIDDETWIPSRISIKSWVLFQIRRKKKQHNDFVEDFKDKLKSSKCVYKASKWKRSWYTMCSNMQTLGCNHLLLVFHVIGPIVSYYQHVSKLVNGFFGRFRHDIMFCLVCYRYLSIWHDRLATSWERSWIFLRFPCIYHWENLTRKTSQGAYK